MDKANWDEVLEKYCTNHPAQEADVSDQDDLAHRILLTFPVWLKYQLVKKIYACCAANKPDIATIQNTLKKNAKKLVPYRSTKGKQTEMQNGLVFVDPKNALDLAARLTRVKRLQMSRKAMEEIPEEYRQNHPSFLGRICPVESPESELVGLSLQLAQGAIIDDKGKVHPAPESDYLANLGWGAGLIPFFPHNDGARNMMGSKNLRQAIPIQDRSEPAVKTGGEERLQKFMAPLAGLGVWPGDSENSFALGKDMLVAYLPWKGWNMEDAIVISECAAKALASHGLKKRFSKDVKVGVKVAEKFNGDGLEHGLVKAGKVLHRGDLVAMLHSDDEGKDFQVIYQEDAPGKVLSIGLNRMQPYMDGKFEYEVELQIPVKVGDKLMGRHGNKGVVGKILPDNEMPKLPVSETLGEFSGRPLQVLLNPHGVISRMNIGQLLETHLGWLLHRGYPEKDLLLPTDSNHPCGFPAIDRLNHEKIQMLLKDSGLDETGKIPLVLPDNDGMTLSPVLVGFEHIVRLAHIPMLKAQARKGGKGYSYDSKTGQAVHGRKRIGGQRIGEMEVWALAAYQANHILDEMLEEKSSRTLQMPNQQPTADSTYLEFLKTWLRAMMIDWEDTPNGFRLSFVTPDKTKDFIMDKLGGDHREVTSPQTLVSKLFFDFHCDKEGCVDSHYGTCLKQVRVPEGPKTDSGVFALKLDWLLDSCGFEVKSIRKKGERSFSLELQRQDKPFQSVTATFGIVNYNPEKQSLQAELTFDDGQELPEGIPTTFYCQASSGGKAAAELFMDLEKNGLGIFSVVCAKHYSNRLKNLPDQESKEEIVQEPNGIFDPKIFGDLKKISSTEWGYIRLPVAIEYPLVETEPHLIDIIPVLPVSYRIPRRLHGGKRQDAKEDPNDEFGYTKILEKCQEYNKADEDKKKAAAKTALETSVKNLFVKLADRLQGKEGIIRNKGLGRRVDRSSRMVIAPNPELNWEQVGLSSAILWELMGDLVIKDIEDNWPKSRPRFSEADLEKIKKLPADNSLRGFLTIDSEVQAETLEYLRKWKWQKTAHDLDYDIQARLLEKFL
ncbi:MAG: hypothetical protein IKO40_01710, partial [Kiritimatiellae bacterium]|nr:hypothetical protein [Kiritimatiellia bacterium]